VEHPNAFVKRMFGFAHTFEKAVQSNRLKTYFRPIFYYLMRSRNLDRIELTTEIFQKSRK
jgi:hypothetical protein